jgi:adenosylcobinamide-GDP ribazoletransferase
VLRALRVALAFLTTLPLPPPADWREEDARRGVRAYPLVGLVLGTLLCLVGWLLVGLPDPLSGALLVGTWLLLTGALHFDGVCDLADAVFASRPPEERQRIARDPHVGAFALAAGGVLLLVKASAAGAAPLAALLFAPLLSRTAVVLPMALAPLGAGSRLGRLARPSPRDAPLPLLVGVGLGGALAWGLGELPLFALLLTTALCSTLLLAAWLARRLAGLSGDAYGALIETSETLMLVAAVAS